MGAVVVVKRRVKDCEEVLMGGNLIIHDGNSHYYS